MPEQRVIKYQIAERVVSVKLIRHHWSRRLTLTVSAGGEIRLSMPPRTPWFVAEQFLQRSHVWIANNLPAEPTTRRGPSAAQKREARQLIEHKLAQWQPQFAKRPRAVRIADQSTRWGSASSRGSLSFNWRVIELPESLVDYLIVHELAHLIEANHSPHYWAIVADALPDYRDLRRRLKNFALHD